MEKKRYTVLDDFRGLTLISMMIYHGIWNIVYIFDQPWLWYRSEAAYWWQQSICWSFILLSGFCWSFGKKKWKRGTVVFLAGLAVSLVTLTIMPENRVLFGILTCLGSCMLILTVLHKWLQAANPVLGGVLSFALFLLLRNINQGSLGFGKWQLVRLPRAWYANTLTAYLGCPPGDFFSTDYFSLLPWLFLFLTGYFAYGFVKQKNLFFYLDKWKATAAERPFSWLGRHSLLIYLIHQPVIYGIMCLYYL